MPNNTEADQVTCSCKVGKAIAKHDLVELNAQLASKRSDGAASLRDLADFVNRSILTAALETDADTLIENTEAFGALDREEAIDSIYHVLTDDSASTEQRARVGTRLEQAGVDLEAVRSAWVTHPTVRTHLRQCLEIDTSQTSDLEPDDGLHTIEWARSQCVAIIEQTLKRLVKAGHLSITDIDISLSIRVTCTACEETYQPMDLVHRGGCACDRPSSIKESS